MNTKSTSIYLKALKDHIQVQGNFLKIHSIYRATCQKTGRSFCHTGLFVADSEKVLAIRLGEIWNNLSTISDRKEKLEKFLLKVLADRHIEKILTLIAFI